MWKIPKASDIQSNQNSYAFIVKMQNALGTL